ELGLNDAASYEIDRLLEEYAGQNGVLYGVAEALHAKGEHLRAVLIGRAIERNLEQNGNKPDARLLRIINPFPYRDLIEREAKRHGLDPYFVVALIRQESLFNPKAKSGAGAVGLMQVMPRTGRAVATRLGIRNFRDEMLTDPEINIRIGTAILADHLRNYGGRVEDVLIAYNAGAGRLGRWRSFPERADRDLFIERIPYDETRDYVRIVRTNTYVYRTLYSQLRLESATTPCAQKCARAHPSPTARPPQLARQSPAPHAGSGVSPACSCSSWICRSRSSDMMRRFSQWPMSSK